MSTIKTIGIVAAVVAVLGGGAIAFFVNKPSSVNMSQPSTSNSQSLGSDNRTRPTPSPALTALQSKYQSQLTELATKKDEVGFSTTFKQYQAESKVIMDQQRAQRQAENPPTNNNNSSRAPRTPLTDAEIDANIKTEYTKALANIQAKTPYSLSNQPGRNNGQGLNNQQQK